MVFINLKTIRNQLKFFFSEISNFKVSVHFCLIIIKFHYELVNNLFFLVNYKLFYLFSVLSDTILTLLLSFVFQNGQKFFHVINVCCCLILTFVFARSLNIGISHQSNASFFTPLSYLLWRLSFRSYTSFFFRKILEFLVLFHFVPDLVDNYAKIVDERGRNLMCDGTLPSRLV